MKRKGSGDRFTKYDIVFYGSSENDCKIGQIRSFSRRNKTHLGSATIRPLSINGHELNFIDDVSNTAIDTNLIIKKVVVLQQKQYFTLKYPKLDKDIYYSSKKLELEYKYEEEINERHQLSPPTRNLSRVKASQDF